MNEERHELPRRCPGTAYGRDKIYNASFIKHIQDKVPVPVAARSKA